MLSEMVVRVLCVRFRMYTVVDHTSLEAAVCGVRVGSWGMRLGALARNGLDR